MNLEISKSDITRIGHTCHSKDGFLEIFCKPDTANIEEILLRNILKCFGKDYRIISRDDESMDSVSFFTNLPYELFQQEMENLKQYSYEILDNPC